ncbi:MAG TPA: hypothetical protein PK156_31235 [Polyangium sp.]|nr:hypothetical protein [Polyangium sp.]
MLKALLHRKLRRDVVQSDNDTDEDDRPHVEPTRREDPLTATIFERLAYLPSSLTWNILRWATKRLADGPVLPSEVPLGAPTYLFWRNLRPGVDGRNAQRVEPDVLVSWPETLLIVEAKHYGVQWAGQWVEQIRAVRAMPEHAEKTIWLIAVGGIVAHELEAQAAQVRHVLANVSPGLLAMRWEDLHHAIDEFRISSRAPEQLAILNDIAAALDAWGYRKKTWFSSLRSAGPLVRANESMNVLQMWRVR